MPTVLTWSCHACGKERPDDKIAVFTRVRPIEGTGATFSENIRFCADDLRCAERARQVSFLRGDETLEPVMSGAPLRIRKSLAERIKERWFSR